MEDGYTAIKILIVGGNRALDNGTKVKRTESLMEALREGVGDRVDIAVDLHGRTSAAMAIQYGQAVKPYCPFWLEGPCSPEDIDGHVQVAHALRVPIATGERVATRYNYRPLLERGACAVIQPDVCHTGGITEIRKIASMADAYHVAIALHNPMRPVPTAVNVHPAMASPNFLIQESWRSNVPWRNDVVHSSVTIEKGYKRPADTPGIGLKAMKRKHGSIRISASRFCATSTRMARLQTGRS